MGGFVIQGVTFPLRFWIQAYRVPGALALTSAVKGFDS